MAPHDLRRPFKRPAISDQQKRRELSLLRQEQNRRDAQHQARCLASSIVSLHNHNSNSEPLSEPEASQELDLVPEAEAPESESEPQTGEIDVRQASKLKGAEARRWFARQLMLPEWMIDIPDRLNHDWYVCARPSGKRCFVVSSNGTTISRLRNGSLLHHFPSALPGGARIKDVSRSAQSYCILDCIFHELDQTYYVIDMVCWAGYSLHECTAEFRFFWLNSKLAETGACDPPSLYHKFKFSPITVYNCDQAGLHTAYSEAVPYVKDGLLFYNNAVVPAMSTMWRLKCTKPLTGVVLKGVPLCFSRPGLEPAVRQTGMHIIKQIPTHQEVVLELQDDGKVTTSDDPPVVFGCLDGDFLQKSGLHSGNLLRFVFSDGGLSFVDGKLEKAEMHYLGKSNRARAFADSYSKVMFQYTARHSPLRIDDLLMSINSSSEQDNGTLDVEMIG